jgi:hypothetical protein
MHIISVIGLILLPLVSFSAILQTPYFALSTNQIEVTLSFSHFVIMSISVTVAVLAAWWFFTREAKVRAGTKRKATKLVT